MNQGEDKMLIIFKRWLFNVSYYPQYFQFPLKLHPHLTELIMKIITAMHIKNLFVQKLHDQWFLHKESQ